jgi:hypothetical protein
MKSSRTLCWGMRQFRSQARLTLLQAKTCLYARFGKDSARFIKTVIQNIKGRKLTKS